MMGGFPTPRAAIPKRFSRRICVRDGWIETLADGSAEDSLVSDVWSQGRVWVGVEFGVNNS